MKIKELLKLAENRLDFGGIDRAKQDSEILLEDFCRWTKHFYFCTWEMNWMIRDVRDI